MACGEGLGETLDGRGGAWRFGSFVGQWALPSFWGVVLRGRAGFCWAGGYVWFRYRLRRPRPKAGDALCPGGCVFVQVEHQAGGPTGCHLRGSLCGVWRWMLCLVDQLWQARMPFMMAAS